MTKTKRQKKGRAKTPAPVLKPGEVSDEGLFRKDLVRLEENNRRFFGGRKKEN